jgi:hypothetical protein
VGRSRRSALRATAARPRGGDLDEITARDVALGAGFQDLKQLEADDDLASLRDGPRWPVKK